MSAERSLATIIEGRSLVVVAGSGGVGKTTVSAALGLAAAEHLDGDVLVLTIDPARRLASALGIEIDGNDAVAITNDTKNTLYGAMLDPGKAWDAMIRRDATDDVAERILVNPVYRRIADTFVHGNEYAALGWLDEALASQKYRLVIVDTPPAQNALDFFDAPEKVSDFFTSSLLGWLTGGGDGTLVASAAAKSFGALADRLLGAEFFADVVEFFQLMNSVVPGMVERTAQVAADLAGDDAAFVAVAAPADDMVSRLGQLGDSLAERELTFDGVVINGVEPEVFWQPKVKDVAERIANDDRSPVSAARTSLLRPGAEYVIERADVAQAQRLVIDELSVETVTTLPRLVHSPTDIAGLREIGELLWTK